MSLHSCWGRILAEVIEKRGKGQVSNWYERTCSLIAACSVRVGNLIYLRRRVFVLLKFLTTGFNWSSFYTF